MENANRDAMDGKLVNAVKKLLEAFDNFLNVYSVTTEFFIINFEVTVFLL